MERFQASARTQTHVRVTASCVRTRLRRMPKTEKAKSAEPADGRRHPNKCLCVFALCLVCVCRPDEGKRPCQTEEGGAPAAADGDTGRRRPEWTRREREMVVVGRLTREVQRLQHLRVI